MKRIILKENKKYPLVPAVICLSALFPAEIRSACISPDNNIGTDNIRKFLEYLLPQRYRRIESSKDLIECDDLAIKFFWNGNIENYIRYDDLFERVKNNLVLYSPKESFKIHDIINELIPRLEDMIKKVPKDLLRDYKHDIFELCKTIENNRSRYSGFDAVDFCEAFPVIKAKEKQNDKFFLITLAYLAVMACTSAIWCKPEKTTKTEAKRIAFSLFPYFSPNIIKISYHDGLAAVPRICWATLFPDGFLSKYKEAVQEETVPTTMQWFQYFIPDEYQMGKGKHFVTDRNQTSFSNYWGGKIEGNSCCKVIGENIIREGKKISNKYESLLRHITEISQNILSDLPEDYVKLYRDDIYRLYEKIYQNCGLVSGFQNADFHTMEKPSVIKNKLDICSLSKTLSFLIIIAATWTVWVSQNKKEQELARALAAIIFAQKDPSNDKDLRSVIEEENTNAEEKLMEAIEAFHENDFNKCGDLCREIITFNLADDSILGDAYYYLVRCHDDYGYRYEGYYESEEFKYRALDFGSEDALKRWSSRHLNSLLYIPDLGEGTNSYVVSNTSAASYFMNVFLKSRPANNMSVGDATYHAQNCYEFDAYIKPFNKVRFLLLQDDFEKNYLDLIYILDHIKNWNNKNEGERIFTNNAWNDIKIYVRLDEAKYASLFDTAHKHMDGISVSVHLIDDNKWAAQYLLSHFPLFYPIRTLSADILSKRDITINLNVISESNNALTNWLLREAYWLGCFYYIGITLAINIISPESDKIISRLKFDCPEIFFPIPDADKVSKVKLDDKPYTLNSLESDGLFNRLDVLRKVKNCYSYYIINCDDDISSLNLAIKIREWEVRNTVKSSAPIKSANFPVITYHCENLDIAHMAESMVVHQEAYGDNWYNNYSIIPFGASQHYHWDTIDGGYFEKVGQSVHLQYCGLDTNASKDEINENLKDYFNRCYNRDSSLAVALSMPYRLFQMASPATDHIMPVGWVLKNKEAYSDSISLKAMAKQAMNYENKQEMINYERARWMRYMISRGWQAATADETIKFMKAGNPKRQLYIGLLHGCICSQEKLKELQEKLYNEYKYGLLANEDKRFAGNDPDLIERDGKTYEVFDKYSQFDASNLDQTADIICTSWFSEKELQKSKLDDDISR